MSDNESDYDEEVNNTFDDTYSGLKNVVIILIDINNHMFDENRFIKKALGAVYEQINKTILYGYKKNIAVCLMKDSDIVLTNFNDSLVDSGKKILNLLKKSTDELKDMFERSSPLSLHFTLSECMKLLKNLNKIIPHIVIITSDDDPHKGDVNENLSAIDVALSLKEANVQLIVLPMTKNFNYGLFYGEMLQSANDVPLDFGNNENSVYDTVESINNILNMIIQHKVTIQRHYFRLFSKEGFDLGFWTQYRSLTKSNNLYTNCGISRQTNNPVKQQFEDNHLIDFNKNVLKIPLEKDIVLDKKEITETHEKMDIGFQLLYLLDNKQTSIHFLHRKCLILQNDETQPTTDKKSKLFDDLWHYCYQNKKYMVCAAMFAGNRQLPKLLEFTPDIFKSKPCFLGQFYVDCDEIGDYPHENEVSDENKKKIPDNDRELQYMCSMIDKLKFTDFSPNQFQCYEYEVKSSLIKSQLLDIDVEEVEDTFPTNEQIDAKIGDLKYKLSDIFAVAEPPKAKRSRKK